MKNSDYAVVFAEVPDEITFAVEITECPHHCIECHSPQLRKSTGTPLDEEEILFLIQTHPDITCFCFMGGDADHDSIVRFANFIHSNTRVKVAMYSGDDHLDGRLIEVLDYYKVGSYQKDKGPLSSKTTNQIFYKIDHEVLQDITFRFQEAKF